jgi:GAF domain-containing protein
VHPGRDRDSGVWTPAALIADGGHLVTAMLYAADPDRTIAELRRQLAERTAERDEALDQQTATAEVLQVINSSPGNLAPVFDAMLERAMRLCEGACGVMVVNDGGQLRTVGARGVPPAFAEFRRNNPVPAGQGGLVAQLGGERHVHTIDLQDSEVYRNSDPQRRATVDLGGARTSLVVALRKDRDMVGAIHIYRQEVRPFTDKQIALLENFAAQAVIAMENARLITETREALEQQTATAEVLQVINSSPGDLAPVFDAMLEKAMRLCEADVGTLWTFDGEAFSPAVVSGSREIGTMRAAYRPSPTVSLGRLIGGESVVQVLDVTTDAGYQSDAQAQARTLAAGARTILAVALRRDDQLLGAITTGRRAVRAYSDKQIALLENFAAQAVIAMENARLITETREALDQQTATAEVLQVINSSPGNLVPVFDAILEKAHTLCGCTFGSMTTYDGEQFQVCALRGAAPDWKEFLKAPFRPRPDSPPGRMVAGEPLVHVPDLAAAIDSITDPVPRAAVELGGVRTLLMVPLRRDDNLLGYITACRQEYGPFPTSR